MFSELLWALPKQNLQNFNIDSGSADVSLIEFAKQANFTIIFPYEKVQSRRSNSLKGSFTIEQGIAKLLEGTGLVASFETDGVVTIKRISIRDTVIEDKSLFQELVDLFAGKGDDLVIFPEEPLLMELIEVRGIRSSMDWALDIKQESIGVSESIQSEEIGKFPDLNLAESLQRITGVSIDRSEGEGQFVTVRGLGPQFNTVLSNGRRLATDNQGREFSFDTIASELVTSVSVDKTFSASQPSGGIGAIINIKTARPMATREFKVAGSVQATFDTNSQKTAPQGTVFFSNSNDKLGWLVSLSHQIRDARVNEVQTDGWLLNTDVPVEQITSTADNIFVPRNYDQRVRFDQRTRSGGTLVLQYKVTPDLEISLDYLQSNFNVKTNSTSLGHWFTSSNLEDVVTDDNGTAIEFSQNVGHATDFHARTFDRPSSLSALGLNSSLHVSPKVLMEFDVSTSKASTKDRIGAGNALTLIGYLNRSSFSISEDNILPLISNFESADPTIIDASGEAAGVSNYLDPVNGKAHVMLRRGWNIEDKFDQLKTDVTLFEGLNSNVDIKLGLMYSKQSKRNERWDNEKNAVHCSFCGYFPEPDLPDSFQTIFDVGNDFLGSVSGSENLPKLWLRHDGETLFSFLESVSDVNFDAVIRNNSFTVDEKVTSAYIQGHQRAEWQDIEFSTIYGVRYENTDIVVTGFESDLLALTILDQTELGQLNSPGRIISRSATYNNWLPSLSIKAQWQDNIVARFGLSRSLTRPTMSQLSPSLVLTTTRQGGDLRASSGNPELKPFESTNFDLTLEWYYQPLSYISASYFKKKVSNFIVSTVTKMTINDVTDPSTGTDSRAPDSEDTLAEFDLTTPTNGQTATVSGFEFAIQHDFESGWGVVANMTLVDSNAKLNPTDISQKFALTGLSNSQNLILYYEKGPSQIRLAWNHRDGFLQSLVQIQGPEPTYVRSYQQLDLSASYALNDNFSMFIEGVNITEENVLKHGRFSNQLLLAQQPGARYSVGLRGSF
ncbi:TonB-dependent receptor [Paraglaciecola arctica]|uniref:Argininosuccinate synthase n=1 Tax=Paraglaciecola arctica BSs20135 TaxID=493475 RepID=K6YD41_9ALTE|nr:TonB-dependent receptor [Paraglaciecola arctica]GAC21831.1 argininosuccinate synthase [Paraglaciecola arctica BSs20135]